MRQLAKRREAFATAEPYSVAILGYGIMNCYDEGVLSYTVENHIRVLNVHQSSQTEYVLDVCGLASHFRHSTGCLKGLNLEVHCCRNDIISLTFQKTYQRHAKLYSICLQTGRLLHEEMLRDTEGLFVRHNKEVVFWGTRSNYGSRGNKQWSLSGYSFQEERPIGKWYLEEEAGHEIGSNVCFEVYGEHFFSVFNYTAYRSLDIDWISTYVCSRVPLKSSDFKDSSSTEEAEKIFIWRRQHREGPIDDRWTVLKSYIDEETGRVNISEVRREWLRGASENQRTCYNTELIYPERLPDDENTIVDDDSAKEPQSPGSDTSDDSMEDLEIPEDLRPLPRSAQNFHVGDNGYWTAKQYTFQATKIRAYNASANTFLDLVDDPISEGWKRTQRLRLRVCSRKLGKKSPNDIEKHRKTNEEECSDPYVYEPVQMWPPESPEYDEIVNLMNPPSFQGTVEGVSDNRSLIYATKGTGNQAAIVLVNFDPKINLHGGKKWDPSKPSKGHGAGEGKHINGRAAGSSGLKDANTYSDTPDENNDGKHMGRDALGKTNQVMPSGKRTYNFSPDSAEQPNWLQKDVAMHTKISQGFWFGH
jgi:hypothetical protein